MPRYFLEVAYDGSQHAGFQIQKNADTIQGAINHSLSIILKQPVTTFGSSRTDSGVHAYQNFLHLDLPHPVPAEKLYNINAILPPTIVIKAIHPVVPEAHARFSALSRSYKYIIYKNKNPFRKGYGYYYPFPVNTEKMQAAADLLLHHDDFQPFSKRNTQVHTFLCNIQKAVWQQEKQEISFSVVSNRFLRGMVRGLVATMLKVGREQMDIKGFKALLVSKKQGLADFSAPPYGLFLEEVKYPSEIFHSKRFGG